MALKDTSSRAVAIVGVSAILPDAPDAQTFWENIKSSRYSISEVPQGRWDPALYYDPDHSAPDKTYSKIGGWVRDWQWQPHQWKLPIPPTIADAMDDSQKWAVALAHEALVDYGDAERPLDRERTAVILGTAMGGELHYQTAMRIFFPEFAGALAGAPAFAALPENVRNAIHREAREDLRQRLPGATEDTMPGELANCMAGRVANLFNLNGPNYICDAACASALAAIDASVEGLIENEFDAVLTGGIDRNMGASTYVKFCKIGALSATGTRPYADGADGFVMGEGAAMFVLKRLEDAERNGDRIYAVLRGVGGASDGRGKGITAPNPTGQRLALRRAWENAGLSPATAGLVEGHGTSTRVGDVVEFESLNAVFGGNGVVPDSVALGSVKSNIGHLKSGAGAAGLLKAALSLHEKVLPPSLNFVQPNPNMNFAESPFYVNTELRSWDNPGNDEGVRRAGVSAFGFGGTNFHLVLEEYIPGRLRAAQPTFSATRSAAPPPGMVAPSAAASAAAKVPLQGMLVLGAASKADLYQRLQQLDESGDRPPVGTAPAQGELSAGHRLAISYADSEELGVKITRAGQAFKADQSAVWKALRSQGVYYGSGPAPKVAFLYTGQGSQYPNMLAQLREREPIIAETFAEADRIMAPLIGGKLSDIVFVDPDDSAAMAAAEQQLRRTEITQPAVLTVDTALTRLYAAFGIEPDMVMGHSLGEYGALVASGSLSFAQALEAVSARGREMVNVSWDDNGLMAAVFAPLQKIQEVVDATPGDVVIANINSYSQAVIGGTSEAVRQAVSVLEAEGVDVALLPVSHAFHTSIVAPASDPLRKVLQRMQMSAPSVPLVSNVSGEFYPSQPGCEPQMVDMLARQVASPVQFVKGLSTLFDAGARVFVEVGPKKALQGFTEDVLGEHEDVLALCSNHPKVGDIPSFNHAMCGLHSVGLGVTRVSTDSDQRPASSPAQASQGQSAPAALTAAPIAGPAPGGDRYQQLGHMFADFLERGWQVYRGDSGSGGNMAAFDATVVTGAALGLPGGQRIFDDSNVQRILDGEQEIDVIPTRFRHAMVDKHITRLVKSGDGDPHFEAISSSADVIKLAGRGGKLDLEQEFGVPAERIPALDITTQLAMAAGIDALRDAGIPLVMHYRTTHKGTKLPERWMLPESMRDDTGIVFAAAFPGYDAFADELTRYQVEHGREAQLEVLRSLRERLAEEHHADAVALAEIDHRIHEVEQLLEHEPYQFDRRFLFRTLAMGHSQMAEYIGARGPNTHVNSACASTTQAFAVAEDWIRTGRCRRVLVIAADDVTSDHLLEWVGAGFLASGAAATDGVVEEAALPFDRRRHGMILGMGACGVVVEHREAAAERGLRPICEVLSTVTANSAFHGTRLNIDHICEVMEKVVSQAEQRFGIDRRDMARELMFVSHETYTPARGGSASAEVHALRNTFGDAADQIVVANTKGLTGHAMGVGIEDTVAIKALETGVVPPVANFQEQDPELGPLKLSRGGVYPIRYALRLGAGFGSQISMSLMRWVPSEDGSRPDTDRLGYEYRIQDPASWQHWLQQVTGDEAVEVEVIQRTLRVKEGSGAGRVARPVTPAAAAAPTPVATPAAAPTPVAAPTPAPAVDAVTERVLEVVAGITGYPTDMLELDLDLEADLGIDTVKQAETFAAIREQYDIPRDEDLKLRDYPTIAHAVQFVKERRPDLAGPDLAGPDLAAAAPAPVTAAAEPPAVAETTTIAAPADTSVAATGDEVTETVLAIVAGITGYPTDMLELDLDLEADLGIDTVKQAETFAAIREQYGIPRDENLKLRDYPSIAHAVQFVRERRPDLAGPDLATASPAPVTAVAEPPATVETAAVALAADSAAAATGDEVTETVLAIVAGITGYPTDMLELDLDLEADLGIDTVKQAETFAAIREQYDIPRDENLKLRDYPSIAHAIQFVRERRPDLAGPDLAGPDLAGPDLAGPDQVATTTAAAPVAEQAPAGAAPDATPVADTDEVTQSVLAIVSRITGYPTDMLELDLDLEADLGIDTVKQAETFAAIREQYGIPRDENLKLRDYPSIAHAIQFVHERAPGAASGGDTAAADAQVAATDLGASPLQGSMAAADAVPRRVPQPVLRPALELCKPSGVTLDTNSRVVLMPDEGGVGKALAGRLEKLGVTVLTLAADIGREALQAQLQQWQEQGPISGVYWLAALDVEASVAELDLAQWRAALELRVKLLYQTMRTLYGQFETAGSFLLVASRLGGVHGYDERGAIAPMGGAVTGFAKAFSRERPQALVKAVDFEDSRKTAALADVLIEETCRDPGVVEVGISGDQRWSVAVVEQLAANGEQGMTLDGDTVFAVTGAAGSIVSAITADLAKASGGTFYLLDLVPAPDPDNSDIRRVSSDRDGLKRDIFERLKASGERVTPAMVERELAGLERSSAALMAVEAVQAAGGTARYLQVDLTDSDAVAAVVATIRQEHGRIDVLLHAAGIEISHFLPDKPEREFDLVIDVKCDGWFNLLHAIGEMPLGATVVFSSIAGRFGNMGQTDYSAANDLLCKMSGALSGTRGIAIDWTAWADIGMASRGGIPAMMAQAGIDMLAPEAGIPVIRRELTAGSRRGEVVIADNLGVLMAERDVSGGLDTSALAGHIQGPMLGTVVGMSLHQGLQIETPLSPTEQPFLYDHQIDGTPVLPGVMAMEAFGEMATLMFPSLHINALEDVEFQAPFKFYRGEPQSLYLSASFGSEGDEVLARCRCASRRKLHGQDDEQVTTHFVATVRLGKDVPTGETAALPPEAQGAALAAQDLYQVYFHGPAYQVLDSAWCDGDRVVGRMRSELPPNHEPAGRRLVLDPRLIELCFQCAGSWEIGSTGKMGLPRGIRRVTVYSADTQGEAPAHAIVQIREDANRFDALVVDGAGQVRVKLEDYQSIEYPGAIAEDRLAPFKAAMVAD
jgi:acyl transferase domain-containing protein/acyl carrier protein